VHLFAPEDGIRSAGGVNVRYWVRQPLDGLKIEIADPKGAVIRTFEGPAAGATPPPGRGAGGGGRAGGAGAGGGQGGGRGGAGFGGGAPSGAVGLQSVNWDMRYPGPTTFPNMILWGAGNQTPAAPPGTYQVRLIAGGRTLTQPFRIRRNPAYADVSDADLQAQFDLAMRIRDKVTEANSTVIRIRDLKSQLEQRLAASKDAQLHNAGAALQKSLSAIEEDIYQVRNQSGQDPLNFPIKLNNRLASLLSVVNRGDGRPIGNAEPIFNDLVAELKVQTDRLQQVLGKDLATFNTHARRLKLEEVK
jgi:hypothetical protein